MLKIIENKWFQLAFFTLLTMFSFAGGSEIALNAKHCICACLGGVMWFSIIVYFIFYKL